MEGVSDLSPRETFPYRNLFLREVSTLFDDLIQTIGLKVVEPSFLLNPSCSEVVGWAQPVIRHKRAKTPLSREDSREPPLDSFTESLRNICYL